jgi:mannose-6-phosphate isomerase-like protein (cupin superfamily)
MNLPPRRVICATGPDGKSCVVHDAPLPHSLAPGMPIAVSNVWTGYAAPVDNAAPLEAGLAPFRMEQLAEPIYACMYVEYLPGHGREDPGMHYTNTADHFIVLEGGCVLVLESGDVVLKAGDIAVLRGAVHGWRNDSQALCRLVTFVLPALPVERPGVLQI